jgi:hypothetical protein
MPEVAKYHNPQFDPIRNEAYDFTTRHLGLDEAPVDNIAVITPEQAAGLRDHHGETWGGGYNPDNNTAIVIHNPHYTGPDTTRTYNGAATVHETTHTATANMNEHGFYNEALSGVAEYRYMEWLRNGSAYRPAVDFILQRAGVELWVPRNMRYLDARDASGVPIHGPAQGHTSQGLIAALGVAHTMPASRLTSNKLLAISRRNGDKHFRAMKWSLDTLKPGLVKEIETFPETTDGAIQATAIIQSEARKQGLLRRGAEHTT